MPGEAEGRFRLAEKCRREGRWDEAAAQYAQALALDPAYVEALANLGALFSLQGKFEESEACFVCALDKRPGDPTVLYNFALLRFLREPLARWADVAAPFLERTLPAACLHELWVRTAMSAWATGRDDLLERALREAEALGLRGEESRNVANMLAYARFLRALQASGEGAAARLSAALIGDSHVLSYARRVEAVELVVGGKAWHFAQGGGNKYKRNFELALSRIPDSLRLFLSFGEIDCRHGDGILPFCRRSGADVAQAARATAEGFVAYVSTVAARRKVSFLNVPAPNVEALRRDDPSFDAAAEAGLVAVVSLFNEALARAASARGFGIVDLYGATADRPLHIDQFHLRPEAMTECATL